jgi:hypothetical protein
MEFLSQNLLNTTTQLVVNSSTITAANILNPELAYQFVSDAFDNDSLTSSITINFDATQTIDRIAIMEFNGKKFNAYYNGVTANTFALTNPTTTSQWTSNSATSLYLAVTPVSCTSVTFDIYSTQVSNTEKAVGYIYLGAKELTFERLPNASGYTPTREPKEIVHALADGGTRRQLIQTKWAIKFKYKFISEEFRNDLQDIYEALTPKVFVPFGTGTAWDGILFEANWVGKFEFYKYSDDALVSGFSGSIDLRET